MQYPVADMLTRIRNGQAAKHETVSMQASKLKVALAKVLHDEGYIEGYETFEQDGKPSLLIKLKYFHGKAVITRLQTVSRPGLRRYCGKDKLPTVLGGLGVAIVSTPKGVMTAKQAGKIGSGGEVLCFVE
jgi:small subunit ribosomal protein S8